MAFQLITVFSNKRSDTGL